MICKCNKIYTVEIFLWLLNGSIKSTLSANLHSRNFLMVTQPFICSKIHRIYTVEIFLWLLNNPRSNRVGKSTQQKFSYGYSTLLSLKNDFNLHSRNFLMVTQLWRQYALYINLHSRNFLMVTQPLHCYIAQLKSIFSY